MGNSLETGQAQQPLGALAPSATGKIPTAQLIVAMLKSEERVSDLIFSPGRAPQIEVSGQLMELKFKGLECLTAQDTSQIATDLMAKHEHPMRKLEQKVRRICPMASMESQDSA